VKDIETRKILINKNFATKNKHQTLAKFNSFLKK